MADTIGSFDEAAQREKVKAGFKGGNLNQSPVIYPALSFVNGHPAEITAKNAAQGSLEGPSMGTSFSGRK